MQKRKEVIFMEKCTYAYIKEQSILYSVQNEYEFSENDYYKLYSFFVTYSMCENQSMKQRDFEKYGWESNLLELSINSKKKKTPLYNTLHDVLDLNNKNFLFYSENKDYKKMFEDCDLHNGAIRNCDTERAVIGQSNDRNKYLKLFRHIRNCLAHGKFVLRYSSENEKMIIMQDNHNRNVTARMVLKLTTLLNFVDRIDLNGLINHSKENNTDSAA